MRITKIAVRMISSGGKLKAAAAVTFDDSLVVDDLRIVDGSKGLWVAMPSRKVGERAYKDVVSATTAELRQEIRDAVMKEFERQAAKAAEEPAAHPEPAAEAEIDSEMAEAV